jgi:uncharacterized LabA/DUF88 family protein
MPDPDSRCVILIDYDNLLQHQKSAGVLDVVTKVLVQVPYGDSAAQIRCDVRVYGGWYEGTVMTRRAQTVVVELQRDFPYTLRLPMLNAPGKYRKASIGAELARSLLQEPSHHLINTYRRKGKPANVRVEDPTIAGCVDPDCVLPMMKKLLKTGRCPKPGCGVVVGDLVYRHEQKIVDTMLSCDLIYAAGGRAEHIVLVSSDDDFLPPLRTVLLAGKTVLRFHPVHNCQRASFPPGGPTLIERDL